jgi:hypothetical protein
MTVKITFKVIGGPTDQLTDRPANGQTVSYRGALHAHKKTYCIKFQTLRKSHTAELKVRLSYNDVYARRNLLFELNGARAE